MKYSGANFKSMKIYLSGKISGLKESDYISNFASAEMELYLRGINDFDVINPLEIKPLFGIKKYWFFMAADLYTLIFRCNSIYLLDNWNESKGAKIELFFALLTNKTILK